MTDHVSLLDRRISSAEDVLNAEDIFRGIVADRAYVNGLVRKYFEKAASDLIRYPSEISGTNMSLLPVEQPRPYGFSVSYHEPEPLRTMTSHVAYVLLSPLNRAVEIDLYDPPPGWNTEVFDTSVRITKVGHMTLQPGQIIAVKPESQMLHFQFQGPTVFIKIHSQPISAYEWSFELEGGHAWQSIFAISGDSNVAHACVAARSFADARLTSGLEELLNSNRYQLRWAAAQALGRIGREHGLDAMRRLQSDTHPEIAAAARQVLRAVEQRSAQ